MDQSTWICLELIISPSIPGIEKKLKLVKPPTLYYVSASTKTLIEEAKAILRILKSPKLSYSIKSSGAHEHAAYQLIYLYFRNHQQINVKTPFISFN